MEEEKDNMTVGQSGGQTTSEESSHHHHHHHEHGDGEHTHHHHHHHEHGDGKHRHHHHHRHHRSSVRVVSADNKKLSWKEGGLVVVALLILIAVFYFCINPFSVSQ